MKKWYYEYEGAPVGPVDEKDLRTAAENDTLQSEALVWTDGMADWQPAIAVLPRVFTGLEQGETHWGFLKTAAVILATCAIASVFALGGIYVFNGRNGSTNKTEVAKAKSVTDITKDDTSRTDLPRNNPPKGDAPKPTVPKTDPPKIDPKPSPAAHPLPPPQILEQFGPSVAFVKVDGASGSGFLMNDKLVVTNSHVVEGSLSNNIRVAFPSSPKPEELFEARLVYEDRTRDLAVLRVEATLPPLALTNRVDQGEDVVVIGSPGTLPGKVSKNHITRGILSSTNDRAFGQLFFVIDASINPGNSGGPVFNARGEVIGVATLHIVEKQHMNFIVPYEDVDKALRKAKTFDLKELNDLCQRHDAKTVAARLMTGVATNDTIAEKYAAVMQEAIKAKANPNAALKAVKEEMFERIDQRTDQLVSPSILQSLNKLAGTGPQAVGEPAGTTLRKAMELYKESKYLAGKPEDNTPKNYLDRYVEMNKQFVELMKSLPKNLGVPEAEFARLVLH